MCCVLCRIHRWDRTNVLRYWTLGPFFLLTPPTRSLFSKPSCAADYQPRFCSLYQESKTRAKKWPFPGSWPQLPTAQGKWFIAPHRSTKDGAVAWGRSFAPESLPVDLPRKGKNVMATCLDVTWLKRFVHVCCKLFPKSASGRWCTVNVRKSLCSLFVFWLPSCQTYPCSIESWRKGFALDRPWWCNISIHHSSTLCD